MPKLYRGRTYRTPSRKEQNKILFVGYELDELFFDEEQFMNILDAARRRVIGEFYFATEKNPRYKPGSDRRPERRTDNYIWGVSNKLKDLARYVRINMHQPFIAADQLPPQLVELSPRMVDAIIQKAQHDVLMLVLEAMRHHEIWYDEAVGIWQVCQSSVDYFVLYRKMAKTMVKVDAREFHGRVRSQSRNRGIPAGVSVSFA